MVYAVRRLEADEGVGPLRVYRAVNTIAPELHQTPRNWLRSRPFFQQLEANPTPAMALSLYQPPPPGEYSLIPKAWTELAFENARLAVRPGAPSRLACLFAMLDPLEAFSFTEQTGNGQVIFRGSVEPNAPWAVVDMAKFEVVQPAVWSEDALAAAWEQARESAVEYWTDAATTSAEVLVGGAIDLEPPRLLLIPTLRELGIVN